MITNPNSNSDERISKRLKHKPFNLSRCTIPYHFPPHSAALPTPQTAPCPRWTTRTETRTRDPCWSCWLSHSPSPPRPECWVYHLWREKGRRWGLEARRALRGQVCEILCEVIQKKNMSVQDIIYGQRQAYAAVLRWSRHSGVRYARFSAQKVIQIKNVSDEDII